MMTLEQARENVGRSVTYARYDAGPRIVLNVGELGQPSAGPESGVITSVNSRYVFVRYGAELHAKATDPADLTLET